MYNPVDIELVRQYFLSKRLNPISSHELERVKNDI